MLANQLLNEFILSLDEATGKSAIPDRINTGLGNTTVPNPYVVGLQDKKHYINVYAGNPDGYTFITNIQKNNYLRVKEILKRNGLKFSRFYAATYLGTGSYINPKAKANLENFVGVVGNTDTPRFVWHKYEGYVAGGGQNIVYVAGAKFKLSEFLGMPPKKQDALMTAPLFKVGEEARWKATVGLMAPKSAGLRRGSKRISVSVITTEKTENKVKAAITKKFWSSKIGTMYALKGWKISYIEPPHRVKFP